MKKSTPSLFFALVISFLVCSCKKQNDMPTNPTPTVNDSETVVATITGVIFDENNEPMVGARVTLGTHTMVTNALGTFEFKNLAMSKNNAHIKVVKAGYFNGNRCMVTKAGSTQVTDIKLMPRTITGTVVGASGGTVSLPTGGKVTFPANAFVDASGTAYTGTVNVAMAWLDPTGADLGQIMQGDLRAINMAGAEVTLQTYGMLNVEITSTAGQELKIATGKTAELRFPLPTNIQAAAPATIPLWYFDETRGRWMEEGSATKSGSEYVGNVKHFTIWSLYVPGFSNVYVNLTLKII